MKPPHDLPFRDAQLKIWHAEQAKKRIDATFLHWCNSEGMQLVQNKMALFKGASEIYTNLTAITKIMPPIFPLLIGDCIHNISTAYDQILTEVAIVHGGDPTRTSMPIRKTKEDVEKALRSSAYENIPPRVKDILINEIQPFRDGNFTLWSARQLDNVDKHRMITPAVNIAQVDASLVDAIGATVSHCLLTIGGGDASSFPTMRWPLKKLEIHGVAGFILIHEPSIFDKPAPLNSYIVYCAQSAYGLMEALSKEIYGVSSNQTWREDKM